MGIRVWKLVAIIISMALFTGNTYLWAEEEEPKGLISAMSNMEERPTASADVSVLSKYVWRGYELSDDSIVLQPSMTISYKGFSMNLWGNLDTDVDDAHGSNKDGSQFNETDWTLSYAKSFGLVSLEVGYIYYALEDISSDYDITEAPDDSEELYLSVGFDTFLAPTLTVYREIAHLPGWYFTFDLSHSFELPRKITLDIGGSVGYYYSDDSDFVEIKDHQETRTKYQNFHNGLISVGLTIPINSFCSVSPMLAYSFPLTDDADDQIKYANGFSDDSDYAFGGVTISIVF